ncbi:hypothetical protein PoMZ_01485, partial [Pyricularia oryzae]
GPPLDQREIRVESGSLPRPIPAEAASSVGPLQEIQYRINLIY